ncbi:carboxypeptidase-like regulatory domain-containing protein [Emticicia sp. SJ17W-69]|uniref:carboxypeptidase-like regulatory domain-containing protein n=1 Tax=Emticicia sp. SJ17W-69 TaxID=3421657 RepID=UPI003EB783ED
MKYIFTILILVLFPTLLFSQSNWQISGKVLEKNNLAVPFANVFVNNTSIGTTTNINGEFVLNIPARIQKIELVISFVGYMTLKQSITKNVTKYQNLTFILQNGVELNEVKVTAKHDNEWKRKWRIFSRGLLGESDFYKDCTILNPEVIRLEYDKDKKVIATANEPIIIQNDAFGLKIYFQMEKFESDGDKTFYAGFKFFENIDSSTASQQKKWIKNRKRAYNDSFRNFLVSLAQKNNNSNRFAIFKVLRPKEMYYGRTTVANEIANGSLADCKMEEIVGYDEKTDQYIIFSTVPLMVFVTKSYTPLRVFNDYPHPYSIINLVHSYAGFTKNGWLAKPNGILIQGYWGREGFSNMLPEDYFPDNFEQKDSTDIESKVLEIPLQAIAPKVYKTDSVAKTIIAQDILYDKSPIAEIKEEKKEFAIVSNDIDVKISDSDINLSIFDLLRRIPGLMVTNVLGSYQIHFRGTNSSLGGPSGPLTPALVLDGTFMDDEGTVMNILNSLNVSDIKSLGAVKYGNSAAFGSRGGNGVIVINTKK